MIQTVTMAQQLFAKAALVDAKKLAVAQKNCDLVAAESLLQDAFATDVRPAIQEWRDSKGLPKIRCRLSGRVAIWNESPKIARRRIRQVTSTDLSLFAVKLHVRNGLKRNHHRLSALRRRKRTCGVGRPAIRRSYDREVHRFSNQARQRRVTSLGCRAFVVRNRQDPEFWEPPSWLASGWMLGVWIMHCSVSTATSAKSLSLP